MENYGSQRVLLWASFVFFLGSLLLRQEAAINQDLGRHLRLGEMIVAGGDERKCALYSNCLTYTYPDYPFVNHHWGAEAIFYLIYKLGGFSGLILFKAMVLGAALGITALHTANRYPLTANGKLRLTINDSRLTKNVIAVAITFFSVQMMADRLTTRPEIFGYLLFSLLFFVLNKNYINSRRSSIVYIVPALMLVWVNLHISFVFGLILIWIWAGVKIFSYQFSVVGYRQAVDRLSVDRSETDKLKTGRPETENGKQKTNNRSTLAVAFTSTLVTLFNPSGLRGAMMPLTILKDYGYTIVENMTPFFLRAFKPQPEYWIYAAILLITSTMFITSNKRPSVFSILAFYLFSIFPVIAVRHLAFFGLVAPVVLAPLVCQVTRNKLQGTSEKFAKLLILISGGLIFVSLTNPVPLAYSKLPPVGLTIDNRHGQAVEFIKKNNLTGRMWNNYDIGSFLEWSLPQDPTFVDGRPEAFPAGFFKETYIPMQERREKWDEAVEIYDIRWAFAATTDATPWFREWWKMIQKHEGWKQVYVDKVTAVYAKL